MKNKNNGDNSARFLLGQIFNPRGRTLIWVGVNPSKAAPGEENLDNTIRKIRKISQYNGYENWIVINLYPQRTPNPDALHTVADAVLIRENLQNIQETLEQHTQADIVLAYGNLIAKRKYLQQCYNQILLLAESRQIKVIKLTKKNNPVHPLYQANSSTLIDFYI